jgi:hypothetical protein
MLIHYTQKLLGEIPDRLIDPSASRESWHVEVAGSLANVGDINNEGQWKSRVERSRPYYNQPNT